MPSTVRAVSLRDQPSGKNTPQAVLVVTATEGVIVAQDASRIANPVSTDQFTSLIGAGNRIVRLLQVFQQNCRGPGIDPFLLLGVFGDITNDGEERRDQPDHGA